MIPSIQLVEEHKTFSRSLPYADAVDFHKESTWQHLSNVTVGQALEQWLTTLHYLTAKNYRSGIQTLIEHVLLDPTETLQSLALVNHNAVLDRVKQINKLSEASKQARAACYLSFIRFLSRQTAGMIPRASPCREGVHKTFFRVREKVATNAMTRAQWTTFLTSLSQINTRDHLIAKLTLQGGKRINEVLTLATDNIDFTACEILFVQSKTKGYHKETIITYPQSVMNEIKNYLQSRSGLVFVTRSGKRVMLNQLSVTFAKAGAHAGVPFKVTPHVLRASTVTYLKREGFSDTDIMKVTGHASAEMVCAYDKSARADNASCKVCLI